jgi:hypothetical protein
MIQSRRDCGKSTIRDATPSTRRGTSAMAWTNGTWQAHTRGTPTKQCWIGRAVTGVGLLDDDGWQRKCRRAKIADWSHFLLELFYLKCRTVCHTARAGSPFFAASQ